MATLSFIVSESPKAQIAASAAKQALSAILPAGDADFIIAVGGDGTLLNAIKQHSRNPNAIFVGVSAGSLGLLQVVEIEQLDQLAAALVSGNYHQITAPLLAVKQGGNAEPIAYAFNDISVERAGARAAKFHLSIDGSRGTFIGDGIIFSTPLGSTAYSLAAGGPIVDSDVQDIFIVTPNNPHISALYSSLQRPHLLHKQRHVQIHIDDSQKTDDRPIQIIVDGTVQLERITEDTITIYVSKHSVSLLQLEPRGLQSRIEDKRLGQL